jgi:hypothetical protein
MHKYTAHNMKYLKDVIEIRREMRRNKMVINVKEEQEEEDFDHHHELQHSNSV